MRRAAKENDEDQEEKRRYIRWRRDGKVHDEKRRKRGGKRNRIKRRKEGKAQEKERGKIGGRVK